MIAFRCSAAAFVLHFLTGTLHAQLWDGGDVDDNNWSSGDNWVGNVAPIAGADVAFGGSVRLTPNLDSIRTIGRLIFINTSGAFTFGSSGGFTLTINGISGVGIRNDDTDTQTFNHALSLGGSQAWSSGSGPLIIGGAVGVGGNTLTLTGASAALTVNGVISGTGGLIINNSPGTVVLGGAAANTFTGLTTVESNTLILNKTAGQNAIAGSLTIGDGAGAVNTAVVQLNASNQIDSGVGDVVTVFSDGQLNANGFTDVLRDLTVIAGNVNVSTVGSLLQATTVQMTAGNIFGTGGFGLFGNLTVNNSSGGSTVSTGIGMSAGASHTFTVADGGSAIDLDMSGALGTGTASVVKAGAGTMRYSGTGANVYTGTTTVNEGALELGKTAGVNAIAGGLSIGDGAGIDTVRLSAANQIADALSVTIFSTDSSNRGVLDLNGNAETIASLTMTGGVATLGGGTLTVNGSIVTNAASSDAAISTGTLNLGGAARNLTIAEGAAANDLDVATIVTNGGINKLGPGTLRLSADNTFAGGLIVNAGTVAFGSNSAAGTGDLFPENATIQADGASRVLANPVVFNGNPIFAGGANTLLFNGNALLQTTPVITVTADSVAFGGGIAENAAGRGLIKAGTGDLVFSGVTANSYTGVTTVNAGTLVLNKSAGVTAIAGDLVIGDGTGVDIVRLHTNDEISDTSNVTINSSGTLNLLENLETIGSLTMTGGSVSGNGFLKIPATLTSNVSTLTAVIGANLDLGGGNRTFSVAEGGAINDLDIQGFIINGGITKTGAGLLRFSGESFNPTTGPVTVNGGTLVLAKSAFNGSVQGPLVIGDNSGPDIVRLDADEQISSGFPLTLNSAGLLNLNGFNESVFGVTMTGGSITSGSGTLTLGGDVITNAHSAAANITGNLNLGGTQRTFTVADGTAVPDLNVTAAVTNGGIIKAGAGTMNISGSFANGVTLNAGTLSGTIIVPAGATYTQNGGIFAGALTVQGTFVFNGGSFTGTLNAQGAATLNANLTVAGGLENSSTLTVGSGVTLTANGSGFTNLGTTTLSNGTIAGVSATNDFGGQLDARGTISAPFTNNGTLDVTGLLTLSAASSNAGSISVATTESLRVNGTFSNSGVITLSGGSISGTGTVTNTAGGAILGRGAVSAPMASNAGSIHATGLLTLSSLTDHAASGELLVDPGVSLNISTPFTSAGFISLRGTDARLASGALTNNGIIDGTGRITSPIINNGVIRAVPGTLTLGGPVTNNSAGRIEIGDASEILASGGLAASAGLINLAGGRFENVTASLTNTGLINGHGTLATGGLTNNGTVTLTGGDSTVHGNVTNAATKFFRVTGDSVLFTGNFTNNGTFKNTSADVVFAGTYTENGVFISDPASNWFLDLVVSPTGYLIGGEGDVFIIGQDFLNGSAASADWNTSSAALEFSGAVEHSAAVAGADFGPVAVGYTNNFAWKSVSLAAGESLIFSDGNGAPGGALYTRELLLEGGLLQIAAVTGDGHNIYYSPGEPANAYLAGGTYPLTGGGSIIPVQTVLEILSSTILPAGEVQLSVLGVPGGLHRVEASADLVAWSVIGNASAAPDGTFTFTDNGAPAAVRRFYRVSFP